MLSPIPRRNPRLLLALFIWDVGLPQLCAGSASALSFSRPARRSLTLHPAWSPNSLRVLYTEGFSRFVTSTTAPIATGWSVLPGGVRTRWNQRLSTAHAKFLNYALLSWLGGLIIRISSITPRKLSEWRMNKCPMIALFIYIIEFHITVCYPHMVGLTISAAYATHPSESRHINL